MNLNIFGLRIFVGVPYRGLALLILLNVLVVVSYFFMMKIRQQRVIKFGNFETLKRIEGTDRFSMSPWLLIFEMVIITLLFLVATNSIKMNITKPVSNTDFVIAIDTSPSMLTPDYTPNRLGMAKRISISWLNQLPESTRVGVVTFSNNATRVLEPTSNYWSVKKSVENISKTKLGGGTALGNALLKASSMLKYSSKQRVIVLITDGQNNENENLSSVINALNTQKIMVYSIGIGDNKKTKELYEKFQKKMKEFMKLSNISINQTDDTMANLQALNATNLELISNKTGGKTFVVRNETGMDLAFSNIFLSNQRINLDSDYYILLFLAFLMIIELLMFAKYGAI